MIGIDDFFGVTIEKQIVNTNGQTITVVVDLLENTTTYIVKKDAEIICDNLYDAIKEFNKDQ